MDQLSSDRHFLILGGGLAGTFLAHYLLANNQAVTLVDDHAPHAASRVAVGLYNVITGRFGAKSWQADTLLPFWQQSLGQAEFACIRPHVFPSLIYRPFKEVKEYNKWTGRVQDPEFGKWVAFQEQPIAPQRIANELGGIRILPCGWTQTGAMVEALLDQMKSQADFQHIPHFINPKHIDLAKKCLNSEYGAFSFDQIILCPGYHSQNHPLWPGLPIIPNKGELLLLEIPELKIDFILSKKAYLIPLGNDQYIAGSTYYNQFDDPHPSSQGRADICEKLDKVLKVPYRILDHKAGIRPTSPDRRPLLGTHPQHDYVHIFSGLGTKGVLLAPYYGKLMSEYLVGKINILPPEVSTDRFKK